MSDESSPASGQASLAKSSSLTSEQILEWSKRVDPKSLLIPNDPDYAFKDPFVDRLRPHQAFMFSLGLEQVLERACESVQSSEPGSKTLEDSVYLRDKEKFFSNLDENLSWLRRRNEPFKLPLLKCHLCNFRAESRLAIDQHLTQPHFFIHKFQCNFCQDFSTTSTDSYKEHLRLVHNRTCKIEKPLSKTACEFCDYEGKCEPGKLFKHQQFFCPYRQVNLKNNNEPNDLLDRLQAPSMVDVLDYEYMFNERPVDKRLNNFGQTVYLNSNSVPGGNFFENVKTLESLLKEERPRSSSVLLPSSTLCQALPNGAISSAKPRDLSDSVVVCFKCSTGFHGDQENARFDRPSSLHAQVQRYQELVRCLEREQLDEQEQSVR